MTETDEPFGTEEGAQLLRAGWAQGSVVEQNRQIQPDFEVSPEAVFIVCTQACTVVSPDIKRDPWIELAVASPIKHYAERSPEATGKNGRCFHMPVGEVDFPALEIDINRRFFIPRRILLSLTPKTIVVETTAVRSFAGWLGRYYTRVALPNELVARIKAFFDALTRHLRSVDNSSPREQGNTSTRVHERVVTIFIRWSPDAEIDDAENYNIELLAICDDAAAADELERKVSPLTANHKGLLLSFSAQSKDETILSDVDGWTRLSEWDYLSGMEQIAKILA